MTCHVGNCLYDDIEDDAAAMCPDASFTPPEFWTGDFVTKIAMFGLALSLVCLATLYVKVENKALYSLEPHTDAFERMIAAASMPRSLDQHPPHHVRTVSVVVGTRRRLEAGGAATRGVRRSNRCPRRMPTPNTTTTTTTTTTLGRRR